MENVTNGNVVSGNDGRGAAAYQQMLPEYLALPPEKLATIGVDIRSAVMTVMGALPEIRSMAADIQRVEPEVNTAFLDKLELGTYALIYSNARYLMDGEPSNDLLALANEGAALRDQLLKDAEALSSRKIVDGKGLAEIQRVPGYKNIATDLSLLSVFLRENWSKIQGKSAIEYKEIGEFQGSCRLS